MVRPVPKQFGRLLDAELAAAAAFGKAIYVDPVNGNDDLSGLQPTAAKASYQEAHDIASAGDAIIGAPGDDAVELTVTKSNLSFKVVGARGSGGVAADAANGVGVTIDGTAARVEEVTFRNFGMAGVGTGGGLHIKGDIRRITAEACKIEGEAGAGGFSARLESTAAGSVADTVFKDKCEFTLGDTALHFKVSGGGDPVTQTLIEDCKLNNFATRGIHAETVHTVDLWAYKNMFGSNAGGVAPTAEFVKADVASTTGHFAGNQFATATNAATKLAIAAGVLWGPNGTESGWSTARPA